MMTSRLGGLALLLLASTAEAQQARVTVRAESGGTPVAGADVTAVQDYLNRFGYLEDDEVAAFGAPVPPLGEGDDMAAIAGRPVAE